MTFRLK